MKEEDKRKDYVKPTCEIVEIKPEEWLTNDSGGGGAHGVCKGNDNGVFSGFQHGCKIHPGHGGW